MVSRADLIADMKEQLRQDIERDQGRLLLTWLSDRYPEKAREMRRRLEEGIAFNQGLLREIAAEEGAKDASSASEG